MDYVVGFLFDLDSKRVLLIRKKKPEWQKGRLNGIGGKIEEGETPLQAMIREFKEETGAEIKHWRLFSRLIFHGPTHGVLAGEVWCFASTQVMEVKSTTDEIVNWERIYEVMGGGLNTLPNIPWLVAMALDPDNVVADIHYHREP